MKEPQQILCFLKEDLEQFYIYRIIIQIAWSFCIPWTHFPLWLIYDISPVQCHGIFFLSSPFLWSSQWSSTRGLPFLVLCPRSWVSLTPLWCAPSWPCLSLRPGGQRHREKEPRGLSPLSGQSELLQSETVSLPQNCRACRLPLPILSPWNRLGAGAWENRRKKTREDFPPLSHSALPSEKGSLSWSFLVHPGAHSWVSGKKWEPYWLFGDTLNSGLPPFAYYCLLSESLTAPPWRHSMAESGWGVLNNQ